MFCIFPREICSCVLQFAEFKIFCNTTGLDDLAEYAGHANTRTIRRYANQDPLQLHQIIKDADDLSRVIEGMVDLQAAAQGLPALRWFIGYDADGEPMYCGNQVYVTCPHRLDCKRCGMFIGGEKARLLREGEQALPVTSKVPMTPLETCVVEGDQVPQFHAPPDTSKRHEQTHRDDHEPLKTFYHSGGGGESDVPEHSKADDKRTADLAEPIGEALARGAER